MWVAGSLMVKGGTRTVGAGKITGEVLKVG